MDGAFEFHLNLQTSKSIDPSLPSPGRYSHSAPSGEELVPRARFACCKGNPCQDLYVHPINKDTLWSTWNPPEGPFFKGFFPGSLSQSILANRRVSCLKGNTPQ